MLIVPNVLIWSLSTSTGLANRGASSSKKSLQHETMQTTFDTFNQSQHLLPTLHNSFFASQFCIFTFLFFLDFTYLLLEREEGREKQRERNMDVQELQWLVASCTPPNWEPDHNPGMCPDWESNQPFSSQAGTQPTEPHQPGKHFYLSWNNKA